jgi:hypothetical protein
VLAKPMAPPLPDGNARAVAKPARPDSRQGCPRAKPWPQLHIKTPLAASTDGLRIRLPAQRAAPGQETTSCGPAAVRRPGDEQCQVHT